MAAETDTTRLRPVPAATLSPDEQDLLGPLTESDGSIPPLFATLVRHPGLLRKWLPFAGKLLSGKLPARDREVLILRACHDFSIEYEWIGHVAIAKGLGVTDTEIEAIRSQPGQPELGGRDATLIAAVDDLHTNGRIGDQAWAALTQIYDERQLVEIPVLVGNYVLLGYTIKSLGIQCPE